MIALNFFMDKGKIYIKNWLILPLLALVVFGMTRLFIRFPFLTERIYSHGLYPFLASVISALSKWIPFSLDDLFYFLLIAGSVIVIVMLVMRKISLKVAGIVILNSLAGVYILFYVLWGFNYFRADLNTRLNMQTRPANQDEFMNVFQNLVESTNNSRVSFKNFNEAEIAVEIEASYNQLAPVLKIKYPGGSRKAKPITLSRFFAQAGISGYFGPFFNEVHVNRNLLPVEYPFVLAHEKAHQFGITGESEANFYAWLVCRNSNSKQLQYSANLIALRYFMNHAYRQDGYREVVAKIDKRVIDDIRKIQEHWMSLRNEKVEAVAERVNDAYLKTNQVEEGIRDYTGIVRHIMDFSLDNDFRELSGL